ncbi:flagellar hook-associated protein FlgL [Paraburkholderia bonniea]|uniref:flagellar hook-associated protein FlgL n=1 Tax=Paraburkholderia bonniea TaxID=2152891 RepID=UPI0012914723|nr:flagellar hook-associated protein FlgL [Paraburkholderia bonniea]WJF90798.1 flagellar hook-associated protein FlgL [Paraburkholderia bonniea]WJF94112.1 flagellar hook-associated protein FlgL [Paraburkholderia bonniea]
MRISSQQFGNRMVDTLRASNQKLSNLMMQIDSGRRILNPSDDPVGGVRLLLLERDASVLSQYRSNIGTLSIRLQQNESHLDGLLKTVVSAKDLMLRAADSSTTSADLHALAGTLESLKQTLVEGANVKDSEGNYLFSGTLTNTAPLGYDPAAPEGSRYRYNGNYEQQKVVVGHGVTQAANSNIAGVVDLVNQLDAALTALKAPGVSSSDPATHALINASLGSLDSGVNTLSGQIASLGGMQNTLDLLDQSHEAMLVSNGQAANMVGQLDYAEAYDKMSNYMVAVQGTYKVYGRVAQLSLFDIL